MKYRTNSRFRGILFPAIAAFFLGLGIIGCSSSGEEAAPDVAVAENSEGANADPLANDANANTESTDGAAAANGANSEELSNLVNEGSDNAASAENPTADAGLNANAGADPFANPAANGATPPVANNAVPLNGSDPAALGADAASNTAGALPAGGENNGADPFASADSAATTDATTPAAGENIPAGNLPAWNGGGANGNGANVAAVEGNNSENANAGAESEENVEQPALSANSAPAASGPSKGYVPEKGTKLAYYVSRGDTLGTIAQKIYGNKGRWKELATTNNLTDPNKIYPGDALLYTLDDASQGFAEKYESAPRQSVTVNSGDSLSSIAGKVFGSQAAWRTLWKENPNISNPDMISAGMTLYYRAGGSVAQNETDGIEIATAEVIQE